MPTLTIDELIELTARALRRAGAAKSMALAAAKVLVAAESEGLTGHGVSRTALYAQHLRERRVDGKAKAKIVKRKGATCLVDAQGGLAYDRPDGAATRAHSGTQCASVAR